MTLSRIQNNKVIKFILVGGCSTLVDFIIYMIISAKLPITLSKTVSMVLASVFSYVANKGFTFHDKNKTNMGYVARFYLVFVANLGSNLGLNYLTFVLTGNKGLAFVVATVCGMIVNYLGQRFFVFEKQK